MVDLDIDGIEHAEEIGRGGFATVYRGLQPQFRRDVAIKMLQVGALDDESRARFERECGAMGSLSAHPRIVTVHDAGINASGVPYLVMAYMSGGSLGDRLRDRGALSWQDAIDIGAGIADALHVAHQRGVIHRDVKPDNILISEFGDAQLSDFGIARITGAAETRSGTITASLAYAPPEVLEGSRPTAQSDIYSLGATIFALIGGTPPFERHTDETQIPQIKRIIADAVPVLNVAGMPSAVNTVLGSALAKDPAQRPASALLMAAQLRSVGDAVSAADSSATTLVPPRLLDEVRTTHVAPAEATRSTRRKSPLVLAGMTLIAGVVAAGFLTMRTPEPAEAVNAPPELAASTSTVPPTTVFVVPPDRHIIVLGSFDKSTVGPPAADTMGRVILEDAGIPAVRVRVVDSDNWASLTDGLWVVTINEFFATLEDAASACWNFGLTDVADCFARPQSQDPADLDVIGAPTP